MEEEVVEAPLNDSSLKDVADDEAIDEPPTTGGTGYEWDAAEDAAVVDEPIEGAAAAEEI